MEKYNKLISIGEECIEKEELIKLLKEKPESFKLYDGFEPSGRMHIAQGLFKSINVNLATSSGGTYIFWIADFFALMNDKMGGDLDKIKIVGEYLIEIWKATGMNMEKVKFIWASDAIIKNSDLYISIVTDIASKFTISRIKKCCQIMGRTEDNLSCAQVLYPIMQCADVFFLKTDICQLGMDQRKVNMLAREYSQLLNKKFKPIILSHHMLIGLKEGQEKMSKSDLESAIFMEDSIEDINRKINNAYCPLDSSKNPCLDYIKYICFHGQENVDFAGYKTYDDVVYAFLNNNLSEIDLKNHLSIHINEKIRPVREHFSQGKPKELLNLIKSFNCTSLNKLNNVCIKDKVIVILPKPVNNNGVQLSFVLNTLICILKAKNINENVTLFIPDIEFMNYEYENVNNKKQFLNIYINDFIGAIISIIKVDIIKQSDLMKKNPLEYLLNIINYSRSLKLNDVCNKINIMEGKIGNIIGIIFTISDLLTLNPMKIIGNYEIFNLNIDVIKPINIDLIKNIEDNNPEIIYLNDNDKIIKNKIKKTYCEIGNIEINPILNGLYNIINQLQYLFKNTDRFLNIQRSYENGGDIIFYSLDELILSFSNNKLHPGDLKNSVTHLIIDILNKCKNSRNF